ncbi:MAG: HD domain-containing protein [Thermoleophilia bacterium]
MARDFLTDSGVTAWLVGGTVRDLLLKREPGDIDMVTDGPPEAAARRFADKIGGSYFQLSEEFQSCRVITDDHRTTYDFSSLRGAGIEADLNQRDFTVNAMAARLFDGEIIDPLGGLSDLESRLLVPVDDAIFDHDPLRLLRALRLEKELGFSVSGVLETLIRAKSLLATRPAVERIWAEMGHLLEAPGAAPATRRMDELGLLEILLPEVHALKGVSQNEYHHLDVYNHVLAASDALDRVIEDPAVIFPRQAERILERSNLRIAGDASWRFVMGYSAIMHDIAKPHCRFTDESGDFRFFEHDRIGAQMVGETLTRMKASSGATRAITQLVACHMRFEGLKQSVPPSSRARLRYLRATEPYTPEAIILSVSDQLAVRGPKTTDAAIERHLELAGEMMDESFADQEAQALPKLVGGDELMRELVLEPGPQVGRLLDRILEEQQLGNISSRQEALQLAMRILREDQEN